MADGTGGNFRPTLWSEGNHPLEPKETARLDAALDAGEAPLQTVRGRSNGKAHLWSLTDRRLLAIGTGWLGRAASIALNSITDIEEQEGIHGTTIQLDLPSGRIFLVAVAPIAARAFVAALSEKAGTPARFVPTLKPKPATMAAPEPYRRLEPPAVNPAAGDMLQQLERLAALYSGGQLNEQEFAEAKRKLLQG